MLLVPKVHFFLLLVMVILLVDDSMILVTGRFFRTEEMVSAVFLSKLWDCLGKDLILCNCVELSSRSDDHLERTQEKIITVYRYTNDPGGIQ